MGFWRWLGELIKPKLNKLRYSYAEAVGGVVIAGICAGFAIGLGQTSNCLYYLLFLGLIPGILLMFHNDYRIKMKEKKED